MKLFAGQRAHFPHPLESTYEGLLLVDDRISTEILLEAYSFGIFPWPQEDLPLLWFSPPERGLLLFDDYHVSRSFEKFLKKSPYKVTFNKDFEAVIRNCQKSYRPDQQGTWITDDVLKAYIEFHRDGYAHSVECWDGDRLVGGLYGVYGGRSFLWRVHVLHRAEYVKAVFALFGAVFEITEFAVDGCANGHALTREFWREVRQERSLFENARGLEEHGAGD